MALRRPPTTFSDEITAGDLAANSVGASELADNAVDADAIAANAVTTAKIADSSSTTTGITPAKIAENAVTSAKIATGAVIADGIGAGAVVTAGLGAGAVTSAKIASDTIEITPHIKLGTLYPAMKDSGGVVRQTDGVTAVVASTVGPAGSTIASSLYGTVQSDGKMYYYTDIKGSKPIKDPRVGAHYGSQRHKFKSLQFLPEESAAHDKKVQSIDGREWIRGVGRSFTVQYHNHGNDLNFSDVGDFFEVTGYFNDFNVGMFTYNNRNVDVDITIDGTLTIDGSTTLSGNTSYAGNPLMNRHVDPHSIINAGLSIALGLHTLKFEIKDASKQTNCNGIELIAQNTTSATTRDQIHIHPQNVVSYGKLFAIDDTALHHNPFAFKTDGTTAWASGAHNGTGWPAGANSAHNIDTATSLGLDKWLHSSNYYKPYNGGRVVIWVDSSGNIKTSVTVMPPNARSVAAANMSPKANASIANDTNIPTFETGSATDYQTTSLSEVAKIFHWREFGNGSNNGGALAGSWADASMAKQSTDDFAFVMDDGLTSGTFDGWLAHESGGHHNSVMAGTANEPAYITFIGTGISANFGAGGTTDTRTTVAQNLPYGTHTLKVLYITNGQNDLFIDGIEVQGNGSDTFVRFKDDITFYQPKKPPIPENAVVLADYMLMAEFVATGATTPADYVSKGVRRVSSSRDWKWNLTASIGFSTDPQRVGRGMIGAEIQSNINTSLPYFGTHAVFENHAHANRMNNAVLAGATRSLELAATGGGDKHIHVSESTMGMQDASIVGSQSGEYVSIPCIDVHTPIHTSSHYQSFETPFLHELVGGDRNMEQTNLVVTPDGKTWDEVSRDTSYIGNMVLSTTTDTDTNWSAIIIMDDWRGGSTGATNRPNFNKDSWAIAYDRFICLKDGTYEITLMTSMQSTNDYFGLMLGLTGTGNGERLTMQRSGTNQNQEGNACIVSHHFRRGDNLRPMGQWGGDSTAFNFLQIKKL